MSSEIYMGILYVMELQSYYAYLAKSSKIVVLSHFYCSRDITLAVTYLGMGLDGIFSEFKGRTIITLKRNGIIVLFL